MSGTLRRRRRLQWVYGVKGLSGTGPLVDAGQISPLLEFSRAQAAGVRSTADVAFDLTLVTAGSLDAAVTFTRAQVAGVESTGGV